MPMPFHCHECDCPTDNSSGVCNQCTETTWVSPGDPGDESDHEQRIVFSTSTSRHILPSEKEESEKRALDKLESF